MPVIAGKSKLTRLIRLVVTTKPLFNVGSASNWINKSHGTEINLQNNYFK